MVTKEARRFKVWKRFKAMETSPLVRWTAPWQGPKNAFLGNPCPQPAGQWAPWSCSCKELSSITMQGSSEMCLSLVEPSNEDETWLIPWFQPYETWQRIWLKRVINEMIDLCTFKALSSNNCCTAIENYRPLIKGILLGHTHMETTYLVVTIQIVGFFLDQSSACYQSSRKKGPFKTRKSDRATKKPWGPIKFHTSVWSAGLHHWLSTTRISTVLASLSSHPQPVWYHECQVR